MDLNISPSIDNDEFSPDTPGFNHPSFPGWTPPLPPSPTTIFMALLDNCNSLPTKTPPPPPPSPQKLPSPPPPPPTIKISAIVFSSKETVVEPVAVKT